MTARLCTLLARWASEARAAQQDAWRELQAVDAAAQQHMAQGAMAGADPLTDSLYAQLEAPATEGAQPAVSTGTSLTPQQQQALRNSQADDWWLDWLMPAAITVSVLAYAARLFGLLPGLT